MSESEIRIDAKEIERLAKLAGLTIPDDLLPSLLESMRLMLQNFSVLRRVDGQPIVQHPTEVRFSLSDARRDVPRISSVNNALFLSKDFEENLFFVPKILD